MQFAQHGCVNQTPSLSVQRTQRPLTSARLGPRTLLIATPLLLAAACGGNTSIDVGPLSDAGRDGVDAATSMDAGQDPDADIDAYIDDRTDAGLEDTGQSDGGPDAGPPLARDLLAAGHGHTCLLRADGSLHCWGANGCGQLGYGITTPVGDDETPREAGLGSVEVGASVRGLALGDDHTCVITSSGAVRCWGCGLHGRLGYGAESNVGDDETPAIAGDVPIAGAFVDLDAAADHTCASTGLAVACWGMGRYGKLGLGSVSSIGDDEAPSAFASVAAPGENVEDLGLGDEHSCALAAGRVRCWGSGAYGQLGYGNTEDVGDDETPSSAGNVDLGETTPVIQVASGYAHTCALLASGRVRCWGANGSGQLGLGHTLQIGDDETPGTQGPVDVGGAVTQIAVGYAHTCALLEGGAVRCWGQSNVGQLGRGDVFPIGDDETPSSREQQRSARTRAHRHPR